VQVEIFGDADPDQAATVAAKALLGFLVQSEDASRIRQEHFALLRQPDAAHVAQDQARPDLILEAFDVKAYSRLGEVHLARGFGEATLLADGDEGSQQDLYRKASARLTAQVSPRPSRGIDLGSGLGKSPIGRLS
jgi:hypothetical protein